MRVERVLASFEQIPMRVASFESAVASFGEARIVGCDASSRWQRKCQVTASLCVATRKQLRPMFGTEVVQFDKIRLTLMGSIE